MSHTSTTSDIGSLNLPSASSIGAQIDCEPIREGPPGNGRVFGLSPNQISRRIKKAASVAGLGDGFSGHSPRVGMACDLVQAGIELPGLMTAGRWRTPAMPAHYARNETVAKGAVAQYYRACRPPA